MTPRVPEFAVGHDGALDPQVAAQIVVHLLVEATQVLGQELHLVADPLASPGQVLNALARHGPGPQQAESTGCSVVALVPMGFCYPGSSASGDKPPRPECAPLWHDRLLAELPDDRLDVIIGAYAQKRYVSDRAETLTATVANWREYLPERIVMPHPSPRNRNWLTKNPWFEAETIPAVRERIAEFLSAPRT